MTGAQADKLTDLIDDLIVAAEQAAEARVSRRMLGAVEAHTPAMWDIMSKVTADTADKRRQITMAVKAAIREATAGD